MRQKPRLKNLVWLLQVLLLSAVAVHAQHAPEGRWEGTIKLPNVDLGILVEFTKSGDSLRGTIDIPMQTAKGLQLRDVKASGSSVRFALQAGPGIAKFDGAFAGDSIAGTFTQATVNCTFSMRRAKPLPPPEPLPYKEEEVNIDGEGLTLAGTLTIPLTSGPHPAAILLTGSGPQTRDEEIFGFAVFRVLADHLTRQGFAVLRCDDRGVGKSTGDFAAATTPDFALDARAQWAFLRTRKDIAASQIGLIGHSEGAIVAAMISRMEPAVAFTVLLAGPSVRGDSLILGQVERLARAGGAPDSVVTDALHSQERVLATVRADTGWTSLRSRLIADLRRNAERATPEQRSSFGNIDSMAAARVDVQMQQLRVPWYRRFILYDPAEDLRAMTGPVLALFGSLDMQVPLSQNLPNMERFFRESGNPNAVCKVIPGANHLFQSAKTGHPMEYGSLAKEFAAGVPETISQWILAAIAKGK